MAKVYRGRDGKRKYEWFEDKINVKLESLSNSGSPYSDSVYLDVAALLSLQNRKLVKQGQIFKIKNMRVFTKDTTDKWSFKVGVLPRTWMTRNAWVKARAMFNEMNAVATANIGGPAVLPKWHDFKVFFNNAHRLDETADSEDGYRPVDLDGNYLPLNEWSYSRFADSGTSSDNYYVHMLGDHAQVAGNDDNFASVGIVQAYKESRVKQHSPSPLLEDDTQKSPWGRLFGDDDQTNDVVDFLDADNDTAPYGEEYIGGKVHYAGHMVATGQRIQSVDQPTGSATFSVPSFTAPLGLIRFEADDDNSMSIGTGGVEISFEVEILGPMDM